MIFPFGRHTPFYLAAAAGAVCLGLAIWLPPLVATVLAANAFFATYLALTAAGLPHLTADYLRRHAASDDAPVWAIFLVTLGAVVAAVASLFLMINDDPGPRGASFGLALAAVPLGWLTIHMMAATHYAHVYWQPDRAQSGASGRHRAGLDFPRTDAPSGGDFVYFAYVIGMTAQTSDTAITSSAMRRIAVVHGIVSFFFNTVLVAAAVNVAVSLGS